MNKIYAALDLNKSVKEFKENVTKILELTDVENWDGVKIKNKEEKIINIALTRSLLLPLIVRWLSILPIKKNTSMVAYKK